MVAARQFDQPANVKSSSINFLSHDGIQRLSDESCKNQVLRAAEIGNHATEGHKCSMAQMLRLRPTAYLLETELPHQSYQHFPDIFPSL
ncbi:hypothetical protein F6A13_00990 [Acidithiobacillus sp. 'AMD consortium']|uniref:Uncharacterized protein n=3 Tax=Acidithiobacillus ferridurans TaxID=1232575 RepID=A0A8X8GD56_ACIFI|nr:MULTISPECIES: hypothetical protein [Acidithiobacillus]MBU2724483.1 hypothetical protein [Acidithiobacillus ferridurans]QFG77363.1 hypothetical protein F6A13_00990 [Acidithiobacillus sp. 'AMD consortium']BBF65055.1 hypothetical protein AFERRID_12730 [Acidithiobacillus ferridurans]